MGDFMSKAFGEEKSIPEALKSMKEPTSCKETGESSGILWNTVTVKIRRSKNSECVESPVEKERREDSRSKFRGVYGVP